MNATGTLHQTLDVQSIRRDFPILAQTIHGHPLNYLDNGASTQKPRAVIDAIRDVYENDYSNVHRGVHSLSQRATDRYEAARSKVRQFINARHDHEIIFVRGTTEAINLVAQSFGRSRIGPGDEILITAMEHHSNIVPWQILAQQTGALLKVVPITTTGELDLHAMEQLLGERTRLFSFVHVSNALGTINPAAEMIAMAHARGIPVLLDGAQSSPHMRVNVAALDCDFFAFSGHKVYGPSGIGVLYGKEALLKEMPPYQGGGDMIRYVTLEKSEYNDLPYKFEAGTPSIADAVGLGAAIDYLSEKGLDVVAAHEHRLLTLATELAQTVPELRIIGTAQEKSAILSFTLGRIHPHDIGTLLDQLGIAIRAGHHCAMPVMDFFGVPATARASFGMYNTEGEVHQLFEGLREIIAMFNR